LTCRTDITAQAFLRDSKALGLRVRVSNRSQGVELLVRAKHDRNSAEAAKAFFTAKCTEPVHSIAVQYWQKTSALQSFAESL